MLKVFENQHIDDTDQTEPAESEWTLVVETQHNHNTSALNTSLSAARHPGAKDSDRSLYTP